MNNVKNEPKGIKAILRLTVVRYLLTFLPVLAAISSLASSSVIASTSSPLTANCTLTVMSGNVDILVPNSAIWQTGEDGAVLSSGTRIKTQADSTALLTFFEGSTVALDPGTEVEIKELVHLKQSNSIVLMQWVGSTLHRVVKLTDPGSRYQVDTPSACAMVRGTIFLVEVSEDGSTREQTTQGLVSVKAENQEVFVSPGEETTVEPGQAPVAPTLVKTGASGQAGDNPSLDNKANNPGKGPDGSGAPGLEGATPQGNVPDGDTPPGQTGDNPSTENKDNNPGQGPDGSGAPGLSDVKPGEGNDGSGAPGQTKDKPDNANGPADVPPGQAKDKPDNGNNSDNGNGGNKGNNDK
jgi:hypothetical protein